MVYSGPGVIYAVDIRRHPVRNRLLYKNLILLDDEVTYVQTGTEETRDIINISFDDGTLLIRIVDIKDYVIEIYSDPVSYETLKKLYKD